MAKARWVYRFGNGVADGGASQKALLGGKGANLAEMANLGVPVPPGFTVTTQACHATLDAGALPEDVGAAIRDGVAFVERAVGRRLGDADAPLLLSVRSGAPVSMPGMMDTVLNLGLNRQLIAPLAAALHNERFAWDAYRRLLHMYGDVVLGVDEGQLSAVLDDRKATRGVRLDTELDAADLEAVAGGLEEVIAAHHAGGVPADPWDQLWGAVTAVFQSWHNPRARTYRRLHDVPEDLGTAVNVQAMVFGNLGSDSGTGVGFTRNPATGEPGIYGEYLLDAQGEDVVAGVRTPGPICRDAGRPGESLEEWSPELYGELAAIFGRLERHYGDMQDIEFTIERGTLYILQTRTGKRSAAAAVRAAVDMVREGILDVPRALKRVDAAALAQLVHPQLDPGPDDEPIARGLNASPGAAQGVIALSAEAAEELATAGTPVILVRPETSPDDIAGLQAARGVLTSRGGATSHAAVVARGMGRPCVAGCEALVVEAEAGRIRLGERSFAAGDWLTLDGSDGAVYAGRVPTRDAALGDELQTLLSWADETRRLKVMANADTPDDAARARTWGAEGIGLCRTEHMFFQHERVVAFRRMIFAADEAGRRAALDQLRPIQQEDFAGLFRAMDGLPVTIRLLDPPLHEFLPHDDGEIAALAADLGMDAAACRERTAALREQNPMLGHRGVRLAVTYPEIYEMQVQAIAGAALAVLAAGGAPRPRIMVPLVADAAELRWLKPRLRAAIAAVDPDGRLRDVPIGTMIELPRAALTAGEIAREAEFFSFGTNDLTQTTWGLSRDDGGRFLGAYLDHALLSHDPFARLDEAGVGALIRMAVHDGRRTRPHLDVGICGEHGGEPRAIAFCHAQELDYVSCSPFRLPGARLAAAQAALARAGS